MGYGRVTPDGRLPVFGVATEKEAEMLVVMACPTDSQGNKYARELAEEQTLENLVAFSDRLQECWDRWQVVKSGQTAKVV